MSTTPKISMSTLMWWEMLRLSPGGMTTTELARELSGPVHPHRRNELLPEAKRRERATGLRIIPKDAAA